MSADKAVQSRPRWRVAIVDDHERSRAALRAAIWEAGGEVVGEAVRCADALAAALDLAIARFSETRQLKQTLEGRKLIERAKGTLMARFGLTEDEAFKRLRRAAMDSRKPMVEVARALLVSESVIS